MVSAFEGSLHAQPSPPPGGDEFLKFLHIQLGCQVLLFSSSSALHKTINSSPVCGEGLNKAPQHQQTLCSIIGNTKLLSQTT